MTASPHLTLTALLVLACVQGGSTATGYSGATGHSGATGYSTDTGYSLPGFPDVSYLQRFVQNNVFPDDEAFQQLMSLQTTDYLRALENSSALSAVCQQHLGIYLQELVNLKFWAIKMLDSTGKIPDGILEGNFISLGHFSGCKHVDADVSEYNLTSPDDQFRGQHCTAMIMLTLGAPNNGSDIRTAEDRADCGILNPYPWCLLPCSPGDPGFPGCLIPPGFIDSIIETISKYLTDAISRLLSGLLSSAGSTPLPDTTLPIRWGMCVPSSCERTHLEEALNDFFLQFSEMNNSRAKYSVSMMEGSCWSEANPPQLDNADKGMLAVMVSFIIIVLAATVYDIIICYKPHLHFKHDKIHRSVRSWSFYSNSRRIFSTSTHIDTISCLHGIRFFSFTWIILGHTWEVMLVGPVENLMDVLKSEENWLMQPIMNAYIAVDSFLLISGILISYYFLRLMVKTKGRFNVIVFYIYRYIRLTPAHMALVGFSATLIRYFGYGPHWFVMILGAEHCQKSWWTNMLYINNFVLHDEICNPQTWYLSCEMQLFLVSPIFLYTIYRWPKFGSFLLWGTVLATAVARGIVTAVNEYPPAMLFLKTPDSYFDVMYGVPWMRCIPFLVGIYVGFMFHHFKGKKITVHPVIIVIGWLLAFAVGILVVFGTRFFLSSEDPSSNTTRAALYAAFSTLGWSLALSWLIIACTWNKGGIINQFLSWRAFYPLSRLTYSSYLIQFGVILTFVGSMKTTSYMDALSMTYFFIGHLFLVMFLGFLWSILFEMPFVNIHKVFLNRITQESERFRIRRHSSSLDLVSGTPSDHKSTPQTPISPISAGSMIFSPEEIPVGVQKLPKKGYIAVGSSPIVFTNNGFAYSDPSLARQMSRDSMLNRQMSHESGLNQQMSRDQSLHRQASHDPGTSRQMSGQPGLYPQLSHSSGLDRQMSHQQPGLNPQTSHNSGLSWQLSQDSGFRH